MCSILIMEHQVTLHKRPPTALDIRLYISDSTGRDTVNSSSPALFALASRPRRPLEL